LVSEIPPLDSTKIAVTVAIPAKAKEKWYARSSCRWRVHEVAMRTWHVDAGYHSAGLQFKL